MPCKASNKEDSRLISESEEARREFQLVLEFLEPLLAEERAEEEVVRGSSKG